MGYVVERFLDAIEIRAKEETAQPAEGAVYVGMDKLAPLKREDMVSAAAVDGDKVDYINRDARACGIPVEGERSWRVKPETIAAYLAQFPPRLQDPMVAALEKISFFGSDEIIRSVLEPLADIGTMAEIAPLSPNSGSDVRMKIERAAKGKDRFSHLTFRKDIRAALEHDTDDMLFLVDDNISSATQARAQFLFWCQTPIADWPEECQREDGIFDYKLDDAALQKLKNRPFKILVAAGRDEANSSLQALLTKLGFSKFQGVGYKNPIQGVVWPNDLKDFLSTVGCSLIAWSRYRKPVGDLSLEELKYCKDRAFGYGNVGGMVATSTNVPTATVTPVWLPGIYNRNPWMPLLIRQNKLRHLVIG